MITIVMGVLKMQNMKLLHILVILLCYISDRMFNSLLNTSCFGELFFAFDFNVEYAIDRILNALNSTTALTSSSSVKDFCYG